MRKLTDYGDEVSRFYRLINIFFYRRVRRAFFRLADFLGSIILYTDTRKITKKKAGKNAH